MLLAAQGLGVGGTGTVGRLAAKAEAGAGAHQVGEGERHEEHVGGRAQRRVAQEHEQHHYVAGDRERAHQRVRHAEAVVLHHCELADHRGARAVVERVGFARCEAREGGQGDGRRGPLDKTRGWRALSGGQIGHHADGFAVAGVADGADKVLKSKELNLSVLEFDCNSELYEELDEKFSAANRSMSQRGRVSGNDLLDCYTDALRLINY